MHETYLKYRKDRLWKIIVPVVVGAVLCLVLTGLVVAATVQGADVGLWAAISEIWIAIPLIIFLLVVFALFGGLVYLMAKLLSILPTYTYKTQGLFYKIRNAVRRGADSVAKPVIFLDSLGASSDRIFGRR